MFSPPLRFFTISPHTLEAPTFVYIIKVPISRHAALLFELGELQPNGIHIKVDAHLGTRVDVIALDQAGNEGWVSTI